MPNLFNAAGLLGTELPLSALGALVLLVFYRGLRDERFLRSWMIFEFSQTAFLFGTLFLLFHDAMPAEPHGIRAAAAMATFLIGGLGPLFLLRGFREAVGRPLSARNVSYVFVGCLSVGILLMNRILPSRDIELPYLSFFADLMTSGVCFYIAIIGFRGKATRILAIGCGLRFISVVPRLFLGGQIAFHNGGSPSEPSPQASVYLSILLLQSATSCLIILGMSKVVVNKHQEILQSLDQTMEWLRTANLELDRLAGIDPLTDVANRRALERHLAVEWRRAMRNTHDTLSLMVIDVDNFKDLNDAFGHPAGDACLKTLASLLREIFRREEDFVARIGGDEFVVLLTGIDGHTVQTLAERTRVQMETTSMHCTLSIGCVTLKPNAELKPDILLYTADQALYHAKENGRNQVFCIPLRGRK